MFAIIESGGKQYRVREGDILRLEKLEAEPGSVVKLPVLMLGGETVKFGTPSVEGAEVQADVVSHGRGTKIHIYKFRAKTNYRRHNGHRQPYTEVRVAKITG
jgi:large subunit ribosomal protein L21